MLSRTKAAIPASIGEAGRWLSFLLRLVEAVVKAWGLSRVKLLRQLLVVLLIRDQLLVARVLILSELRRMCAYAIERRVDGWLIIRDVRVVERCLPTQRI